MKIIVIIFWIKKRNNFQSDSLLHLFRLFLSKQTKLILLNVKNNSPENWQCPWTGATWLKRLSFISSLVILCLVSIWSSWQNECQEFNEVFIKLFFWVTWFLKGDHMYCWAFKRLLRGKAKLAGKNVQKSNIMDRRKDWGDGDEMI